MAKVERDSNLELLRIVSMVMIIFAHYAGHGGLIENTVGANHVLGLLLKTGGKIGVICFVLISTYFMSKQKFRSSALLKTILQTIFYAFLVLGILAVSGHDIKLQALAGPVLCIVSGLYWFVTAYVGLYMFQPVLKTCTDHLSEKRSAVFLTIMFITLDILAFPFGANGFISSNFVFFMFLFFVGAHLRNHQMKIRIIDKVPAVVYVVSVMCIVCGTMVLEYVFKHHGDETNDHVFMLYEINSPFVLFGGMSLFWMFKKIPVFRSKLIDRIASNMFGVYLLHDNPNIRSILWHDILRIDGVYDENTLMVVLHVLLCAVIIVAAASVIESVRRVIERLIFDTSAVKKLCSRIDGMALVDSASGEESI